MSTNHTTNYGLCQWEPGDKVLRADFNADNARLETALSDLEERVALLDRAVPSLAFYLGQLSITDLSKNRKNMPQRSMLYEDFTIPGFWTLTGSAQISDGVLQVIGAGKTGTAQTFSISVGYKEKATAKLWMHRPQDCPQVTPLFNGAEMRYTGSYLGFSASGGGDGWNDEYTLECQNITSVQITLPLDTQKEAAIKIHDYALFIF